MTGFFQIEVCADYDLRWACARKGAYQVRCFDSLHSTFREFIARTTSIFKEPMENRLALIVLCDVSTQSLLHNHRWHGRKLNFLRGSG